MTYFLSFFKSEPLNKPISPISTLSTSRREEELRKHQSTPIQIYDPWGKPGAGAPVNNSDGGVRTHRNVVCICFIFTILPFWRG